MERQKIIDKLVENDITNLSDGSMTDVEDFLGSILRNGWKGYNNMDDETLAIDATDKGILECDVCEGYVDFVEGFLSCTDENCAEYREPIYITDSSSINNKLPSVIEDLYDYYGDNPFDFYPEDRPRLEMVVEGVLRVLQSQAKGVG